MLRTLFFQFFPIFIFRVVGQSMVPVLKNDDRVIAINVMFASLKKRDVVVCMQPIQQKILVKRIIKINGSEFFVEGDNRAQSTDSREFGWLLKRDILAKVIYPKIEYNN